MTDFLSAADESEALEDLHRRGCTDGLPVVIPTRERVARMVLASGQTATWYLVPWGLVTVLRRLKESRLPR